ncbi:MAG: molybdopterin molybdotransferase MoeA [Endomicrobiia bacterium]|nr:molybdopterin molybdotransferase MoeA [Endomicrobiia bacterium]
MSFDDAVGLIARTCSKFLRIRTETVRLEDAFMRAVSSDIRARMAVPPFDNSAMDGFAVRSRDAHKPGVRLKIVEVVPAGRHPSKKIGRGECAGIMTGSAMPSGADAVVMKEYATEADSGFVGILRPARRGENVRLAGEDVKNGDLLVPKGALLGAAELGLAASQGYGRIEVFRRAVVGFFTTGDEVVLPGRRLKPSQIYNANRYTLGASIAASGCEPFYAGHLSDDIAHSAAAIAFAVGRCDALVTSGGVSMGDFDIVKKALRRLGAVIIFERIRLKPGRPTGLAVLKRRPVFLLPGNVVSSLLAYDLLVGPYIGNSHCGFDARFKAIAGFSYVKDDARRHFLRVSLDGNRKGFPTARLVRAQGSGILSSMSGYDALAVIPEGRHAVRRGDGINVITRRPSSHSGFPGK